jgi:hypothetical protein
MSVEQIPHLLSMEAWSGCYVPAMMEPASFKIKGSDTPLAVGSLPQLIKELEAFGQKSGLPIADLELRALFSKYQEDDDLVDSDMDIQTYSQLLLTAHAAHRRHQALWIVK